MASAPERSDTKGNKIDINREMTSSVEREERVGNKTGAGPVLLVELASHPTD